MRRSLLRVEFAVAFKTALRIIDAVDETPHPIDRLITEARDKLAKAERLAQDARIEIATLEKARALLLPADDIQRQDDRERPAQRRRRRALSDTWQQILRKIAQHRNDGADMDSILQYCGEVGLQIERASLRGQMWSYVNRGLLMRSRDGVFQITPEGAKAAGIDLETVTEGNGAPPDEDGAP